MMDYFDYFNGFNGDNLINRKELPYVGIPAYSWDTPYPAVQGGSAKDGLCVSEWPEYPLLRSGPEHWAHGSKLELWHPV